MTKQATMSRVVWSEFNLNLSRMAFGCASVMGRVGKRQALGAMELAYELGVTHFDVARSYGFGEAESVLGEFAQGRRDRVTIATKFGITPVKLSRAIGFLKPIVRVARRAMPFVSGTIRKSSGILVSRGHYDLAAGRRSVETSLRQLRTDMIDILFLHELKQGDYIDPALLNFLTQLRKEGKIRAWGMATDRSQLELASHAMGAAPQVAQFSLKDEFAATAPYQGRRVLHSPRMLVDRCYDSKGRVLPVVLDWARTVGISEEELPGRLHALTLQSLASRWPDAVILCSMFRAEHISSNVAAITEAPPDEAVRTFTHLLRDLVLSDWAPDERG